MSEISGRHERSETTARVKLVENVQLMGESGSGHAVIMDGAEKIGGRNLGARPMEMLLIGMGGCSMIDVLSLLRRDGYEVTDCEISLSGARSETHPKVFQKITLHYQITGKNLPESAVAEAVRLSEERYCSAAAMLGKTAKIRFTFELRQ